MSPPTPCSTLQGRNHGGGGWGAWNGYRWARRKGMPGLPWVTLILLPTSERLWAILGSAIVFCFFSTTSSCNALCPCFPIPSLTRFPLPAPGFFLFLSSSHPSACWEGFAGWKREKVGVDDHVLILQVTNARLKSWVHDEDCLGRKVRCKRE